MAALMTTSTAPHLVDPTSHRRSPQRGSSPRRPSHLRLVPTQAARPSAAPVGRPTGRVQARYLRRRVAVLLAASAVVGVVVGAAAPVLHADPIDPAAGARAHVVSQGDTLWGLATGLRPSSDPRAVVDEILELNAAAGVDVDPGGLRVGQRVLLPGE